MARVVVCYKWVKAEEDIKINTTDLSVDLSKASGKISDYDKNAIEAGRKAAASIGAETVGLTFGGGDVRQSLKDALSRGLDRVCWVSDEYAGTVDGWVTSNVLAAAVKKIGDYSVIVCCEGASDTYAHQVGPRLGAMLNIPVISYVSQMSIEGNKLIATRKLEHVTETIEAELPVLVTVLPEVTTVPLPGLKAVLAAGKKPTTEYKINDLGLSSEDLTGKTIVSRISGYSAKRKNIMLSEGSAEERVQSLVASLKKEGVV